MTPIFDKKEPKRYLYHSLPGGCTTVKPDATGRWLIGEWDFHYKGWKHADGDPKHRSGATCENMFPSSGHECLDDNVLKKLGLTKAQMEGDDALFFSVAVTHGKSFQVGC